MMESQCVPAKILQTFACDCEAGLPSTWWGVRISGEWKAGVIMFYVSFFTTRFCGGRRISCIHMMPIFTMALLNLSESLYLLL